MYDVGFSFVVGKAMVKVEAQADGEAEAREALDKVLAALHGLISGTGDKE